MSLRGGLPEILCECNSYGGTWGPDGTIVFSDQITLELARIPSSGGVSQPLTRREPGELSHSHPFILPDGETVLFTIQDTFRSSQLAMVSLSTGGKRLLEEKGSNPRYLPSGHVIFARTGGSLWVAPFDVDRVGTTGPAVPVLEGIRMEGGGAAQYHVSESGTAVYIGRGDRFVERTLVRVDRDGRESPLHVPPLGYSAVQFSKDGTRVALAVEDSETLEDIWVCDIARETLLQLTFDAGTDNYPIWIPDGSGVAFASWPDEGGLFAKSANGEGEVERLASFGTGASWRPWSITPDGRRVLYYHRTPENGWEHWQLLLGGRDPLPRAPFDEVRRNGPPDIARRTMAGLCFGRDGSERDLRAALP